MVRLICLIVPLTLPTRNGLRRLVRSGPKNPLVPLIALTFSRMSRPVSMGDTSSMEVSPVIVLELFRGPIIYCPLTGT